MIFIKKLGMIITILLIYSSNIAIAGVAYNISDYDNDGTSGSDGGLPAIWTNPVEMNNYSGSLNAMWEVNFTSNFNNAIISTADALTKSYTIKGNNFTVPNDYALAVGAKSWYDSVEGTGWGHGLDFGLINLTYDANLSLTVEADDSSLIPAVTIYKGWDNSQSSSRHGGFIDKRDNPLGSSDVVYLKSAEGNVAGGTVKIDLTGLKAGQYTVFVGGNDGEKGGKYKITLNASIPRYTLVDLGVIGSGTSSRAQGVNNNGEVSGYSKYNSTFNATHAFKYTNGAMKDLGALKPEGIFQGGTYSRAYHINEVGIVVGDSYVQNGLKTLSHPVRFNNDGSIADLGTFRPNNDGNGMAKDINAAGVIVGYSASGAEGVSHYEPFMWDRGVLTSLGSFGGTRGEALGINESNQAVGWSLIANDTAQHAFSYSRGVITDLHSVLASNVKNASATVASDVNADGSIVGDIVTASGTHPFLYAKNEVTMLGWLPGSVSGSALAINNQAQVVGYSSISSMNQTHAFLYENGVIHDLNSLLKTNKSGWILTDATAISDNGFIAGTGYLNGVSHAYLLYPLDKKKQLNVNINGFGAVSSVDAGVNCTRSCEYMLNENLPLTLNANASAGFIFTGWSGDCIGIGLCQVKMDENKEVTAKFISSSTPKFYINVTKSSLGMITSSPASISCGLTQKQCKSYFYKGEKVTLTASPNKGQYVKSWKGCTSSLGNSCSVLIAKNVTVTAQFAKLKK